MQKHIIQVERNKSITGSIASFWLKPVSSFLILVMFAELIMPLRSMGSVRERFGYRTNSQGYVIAELDRNERLFKPAEKTTPAIPSEITKTFKPAIGGPGQPEMSSFQSVNNSNMVDLFTGDFSYNIPLMDVGGYPLNIHYTGGITMDQEASWVGLGWNLNPGAISRSMRGIPDDFNGTDSITKSQSIKPNRTFGTTFFPTIEVFGVRLPFNTSIGVFKNTYNGWGITTAINPTINLSFNEKTTLNAGLSLSANSQTGLSVNPSIHAKFVNDRNFTDGFTSMGLSTGFSSRAGLQQLAFSSTASIDKNKFKVASDLPGSFSVSGTLTFAKPAMTPFIHMPTTSEQYAINVALGVSLFGTFTNIRTEGYFSEQTIKKADRVQKLPAFGYMFFEQANQNAKALLDFNREKDGQFSLGATPAIALPQYTYDVYSISGEGTGGSVRPYRGDVGFVRDPVLKTTSQNTNLGAELGFGVASFHGGGTIDRMEASTQVGTWNTDNDFATRLRFKSADSTYQNVYFRNPGEKTSNSKSYFEQVGWDTLMRVKIQQVAKDRVKANNAFVKFDGLKAINTSTVTSTPVKNERDKRTQVISWLNAEDAAKFGLDKAIRNFPENTIQDPSCMNVQIVSRVDGDIRKNHHLSQATVLNSDGKRYIYGLPVYNVEQYDVSFAVDKVQNADDLDKGLAPVVRGVDDSLGENRSGKDNYFSSERIPAYAHSFLLTGILSSDYVDVSDNGISEDDLGDAVKFNYTRVFGPENGYYAWRTPGARNKASYNEGLKTYSRDDKASYFYGRKEVWYTHSIESKTMVAFFHMSANRPDAWAAIDLAGGYNGSKQLRRLDSVSLFSKSDLIKNGSQARPIKTVHFEYDYNLCKGIDPDRPNQGKLTLRKIWFSYYNNKKELNNGYVFSYSASNPGYHPRNSDRWGNFKSTSGNPGGLSNAEYPYALQDSAIAASNASAWQLSEIRLPSHGRIKVTYESDDYAFVQNKKAMAMVSVAGFAEKRTDSAQAFLYNNQNSFDYVFFNSSVSLSNDKDLFHKYLENVDYLYLKLAVNVPKDDWGSGSEIIPIYGKIVGYGLKSSNQFWIKLERVGNTSAITRSVFQFLRTSLPSKAFPGSEVDEVPSPLEVVKMLTTSLREISNAVNGFTQEGMKKGWCRKVDLTKSFARLNVPQGKKYGGGYRVKKIEIFDNWNVMSGGKQESVYGQVYQYRTSIIENNTAKSISSGVAAYEPMIGNEENPFRQPIPYQEKVAPMAPVDNLFLEMPIGESYFPAATVGYSKVRVRTIHTKAKSANGWQESEFYTTRDHPTRVTHTPLDEDAQKRFKPEFALNLLRVNAKDRVTVSQGFLVELNDMNGKPKSNAVYAESDSLHPVSYTRNFYRERWINGVKKLDNKVWVIDSANGKVDTTGIVGLDIELMTDFRQVLSTSFSAGLNANTDGVPTPFGVIPVPVMIKLPNSDESLFRSASLVKVVQRYGIVDSIEVMDKGSIVSTRNLVFDGVSGEPILTRTKNNFNDPIYSFSYPAHWAYSGMGAAYKNIDLVLSGVKFMEGKLYYKDSKEFPVSRFFESGDELMVTAVEDVTKISSSNSCPEYVVQLANPAIPSILSKPKIRKIWAIDLAKTGTGIGIYFIDEYGRGYTGLNAELRILRSGKRNLLSASVGSVAMRNNPVVKINGQYVIQISNSLKVLQASANSFSDAWKVENSLYQIDSCYQKRDTVPLVLTPTSSMLMRQYLKRRLPFGGLREMTLSPTKNYMDSAYLSASMQGFQTRTYKTKTVIKFNLDAIPVNATVISANLALDSYKASGIWQNNDIDNLSWQSFVKSHYISGTDLNGRTNAAVLKNVSTRWSISTPFDELYTGSATVNVSATSNLSCDNRAVNVLSLIQEAKANQALNQGFVFQLSNYVYSRNADELRAMTFNSGWGRITEDADPPNPCFYGAPPLLSVVYSVMKDTCVKLCRYNINDTMTNPYRWGILGNWRADRAYTYFSARESLTFESGGTDIRKQGAILDFSPYWTFNSTKLNSASDTSRWVWNAAQSKFNTRGLETENYDALGRYNAGLYGYKQSMPVAVAQNARSREIWSDGFEDYNYTNAACINCPKTRDQDFVTGRSGVGLDSLETHSGRYSLRVNAGSSSQITIPVAPIGLDSLSPFIIANVDSTPIYGGGFDVVGLGNGLQGTFSGRYMVADREIAWDGSGINPNIELIGANFSEWMLPYSSGVPVLPSQPRKLTILPSDERFINNVRGWAHTTDEIYGSPRTILGTTEQDLYNAERFGVFDYTIPIANGDYTVVFKFCELYHNLVGKRVFNVDLNNNRVLSNFDILANVAKFTAHTRSFNVTVTNGQLKIDFSAVVDNASITAIDIISRSGGEQNNTPATGYSFKNLDAEWVGYIQPAYTDDYTFYLKGSGTGSVFIGENEMVNTVLESNDQGYKTISLQAGQLYPIKVSYSSGGDNTGSLIMSWSGANLQTYEVVPQKVLYTTQGLASGSLIPKVAGYCKSLRGVRASNMLVPKLSPLPDKEYIVTLWVKTDGVDGVVANTANDAVTFKFNNESVAHQFTRTGVKIEGWQRLEALVKAPTGASTLMLAFNAPGSSKLYFDDLRIQPYNSGLKSYVYDHISLKLMAELDENNYTTFYEYDDDGTLIRVKKETERGVQTIKETRSALIKN